MSPLVIRKKYRLKPEKNANGLYGILNEYKGRIPLLPGIDGLLFFYPKGYKSL